MSKVIHDWSSEIEEATRLILEDRDYIYPYTGDRMIDKIFSWCTLLHGGETQKPVEDKILYRLLNSSREKLEEFINNTNFYFTGFEEVYKDEIKAINYYKNKSDKTIEELVYLVLEIKSFDLSDLNGNTKILIDIFKD